MANINHVQSDESVRHGGGADRVRWVALAERIARPVLAAAARRTLKADMPLEISEGSDGKPREAVGRLLHGLSPWLDLQPKQKHDAESTLREELAQLAREAISSGVDESSPDAFVIDSSRYGTLADAAFLALAILRGPRQLWDPLSSVDRTRVTRFMRNIREVLPHYNNWLLFSAIIEVFLLFAGEKDWDRMRVDYALRQHEAWYLGDGVYGDGPHFTWDYYNSLVMHPFLVDITKWAYEENREWARIRSHVIDRAKRYAEIQERMISPEGTYPPIGRSLAYRFGILQSLGQAALLGFLPESISPAQVRSAMTAVLRRQMEAPGTFDDAGWLRIGFSGNQNGAGDKYIVTGSLYHCTGGLLPLGLDPLDDFWTHPFEPWTACRAWSGQPFPRDHALEDGPLDHL